MRNYLQEVQARDRMQDCNCWVRSIPIEDSFALHWGAHEKECPCYRISKDPVDQRNDEDIRALGVLRVQGQRARGMTNPNQREKIRMNLSNQGEQQFRDSLPNIPSLGERKYMEFLLQAIYVGPEYRE